MKSVTVELSEQLEAQLNLEAAEQGMTPSELAREAIEAHLGARHRRAQGTDVDWAIREDVTERIEKTRGGQVIR